MMKGAVDQENGVIRARRALDITPRRRRQKCNVPASRTILRWQRWSRKNR